MEAVEVTRERFWSDDRPVVLAPPALVAGGRELEERLVGESWARGAVVFASSGSSGAPKWIVHGRDGLRRSAQEVNRHLGAEVSDRWFLALPVFHVGGFGVAARVHAADCGFSVLSGRWNAERFVNELRECGGTHTSLVPTQVFDLVAAGLRCPERVRAVVVGGGALENGLGRKARELGWPVLQSYGLTEAGSQVATAGMDSLNEEFRNGPLPVMRHWEARVGAGGVLELRGASLFDGYVALENGVVRRTAVPGEEWFPTTDLVELRDGTVRILGRSDRVVKVLGELVNPTELEARLQASWDGRVECCVLALEDARSGRCLVPVFEDSAPGDVAEVIARLNASLPGYSRLSEARVIGDWPRTPIGKVDVQTLEERANGQ